jgi:hypothetical protein
MTAKTSGDSTPGVSINIFRGIQDSFTTQGLQTSGRKAGESDCRRSHLAVRPPQ